MSTPEELEAERAELDEQLLYALEGPFARDDYDEIREALAPALAAIRRHAAATALRGQAAALRQANRNYLRQMIGYDPRTDAFSITRTRDEQATADARLLDKAADDVIAEGWEHQCAQTTPATREDPAEGCETPVENEGDYCPRHEEGPDE